MVKSREKFKFNTCRAISASSSSSSNYYYYSAIRSDSDVTFQKRIQRAEQGPGAEGGDGEVRVEDREGRRGEVGRGAENLGQPGPHRLDGLHGHLGYSPAAVEEVPVRRRPGVSQGYPAAARLHQGEGEELLLPPGRCGTDQPVGRRPPQAQGHRQVPTVRERAPQEAGRDFPRGLPRRAPLRQGRLPVRPPLRQQEHLLQAGTERGDPIRHHGHPEERSRRIQVEKLEIAPPLQVAERALRGRGPRDRGRPLRPPAGEPLPAGGRARLPDSALHRVPDVPQDEERGLPRRDGEAVGAQDAVVSRHTGTRPPLRGRLQGLQGRQIPQAGAGVRRRRLGAGPPEEGLQPVPRGGGQRLQLPRALPDHQRSEAPVQGAQVRRVVPGLHQGQGGPLSRPSRLLVRGRRGTDVPFSGHTETSGRQTSRILLLSLP